MKKIMKVETVENANNQYSNANNQYSELPSYDEFAAAHPEYSMFDIFFDHRGEWAE